MIYQLHIVACHYFHINLAFSPVNRRLMSAFKAAGLQLLCAKISDRASLVLCGNKTDRFLPSLVVIVVLLFLSTSSSPPPPLPLLHLLVFSSTLLAASLL